MPIITEPKKLSMPQQVQKNKEDIESIFKIIDGLDATDNVVVVPDMSYILSADELKSVRQPVAFIVYDNQLFIKKKEENGNAYFNLVFSIAINTVVSFESKQIEVNLTNGALGITLATVNTYSVSQIDSKFPTALYVDNALAAKASLSGANFTGAITAPSIIENMSGYSINSGYVDNQVHLDYAGVVKNGNKLTFAFSGILTFAENIDYSMNLIGFNIPQEIGNKLINSVIGSDNVLELFQIEFFSSVTGSPIKKNARIYKFSDNLLRCTIYPLSQDFIVGTNYNFRSEITFLLSDNLAQ